MDNLRLLSKEAIEKGDFEFYNGERPLRILSGIKKINIIVGANNSRKSRFMRSIMKMERKVVIVSEYDLNVLYDEGNEILSDLSQLEPPSPNGLIKVTSFDQDNEVSKTITSLLLDLKKEENVFNLQDIVKLIVKINEGLVSVLDKTNSMPFLVNAKQAIAASGLILYLYRHYRSNGSKVVHEMSYPKSPFLLFSPVIPGLGLKVEVPNLDNLIFIFEKLNAWAIKLSDTETSSSTKTNIYIPVLRTSRQLIGTTKDIFEATLIEHYFKEASNRIKIETGLKLYDNIGYARNGNRDEIRNFHAFEQFIGQTFFNSDDIHIIAYKNKKDDDGKVIKISLPGELENVPMHDLGDGIQAIINLLFPIFMASNEEWIFIDEPENHLHPGYQNIFIKAITQNEFLREKDLRYFINTHSNHILTESFLDNSSTSIFVLNKRDQSSSVISYFNQNEYKTLEVLGVMNTSVLITNCTLWVEGVTDRFYVRSFLYAFLNSLSQGEYKPNEGFDYCFIEYAGKNLVHYDFDCKGDGNIAAYFINSKVFLLADTDFDKDKHEKYLKIKRDNFRYEQTKVPEIENLLPDSILKDFLLNHLKCDKDSVTKIFPMKHNVKLGKTFKEVTKNGNFVAFEAKSSGTLSSSYKSKLSEFVYDQVMDGSINWEILSASLELKRIIEELYAFVKSKNSKPNAIP